ncbi:MAG: type II toxin-antitoxin system RelB/DinJ family antitoxin [Bifidobacterium tibiigranuli]|jgi:addiction module RelB/DinJ family antitoxin|nr:type II toxin-antitoxin system RelB/DinJ family antitoxin [Bifidobacterium tibiigranuli]
MTGHSTTTSTVRMDATLKQEAQERLKALGMNFNTFVVMATRQLVAQNRIPFDLDVPNKQTEQAISSAQAWAKDPKRNDGYDSVDDLMKALDA